MENMNGYCGINCSNCPAFLATKNDDDILRMKTSIEWSRVFNKTIVPRQINCTGCKSKNKLYDNCNSCKIRAGCIKKVMSLNDNTK